MAIKNKTNTLQEIQTENGNSKFKRSQQDSGSHHRILGNPESPGKLHPEEIRTKGGIKGAGVLQDCFVSEEHKGTSGRK